MNPSSSAVDETYAVFVPNSPQRHVFQKFEDVTAFMKSPQGKRTGVRFKRCAHVAEVDEFFTKHERHGSADSENSAPGSGDPAVPYSSVPPERLNVLKRAITTKNDDEFDRMLAENPRFVLNTSSDNPTIVQAGFRYNAMHVACQSGNLHVVKEIIHHVGDPEWITQAYGTETSSRAKAKYFLDAFLNTPDKGANNTPLHFAAKYCVAKQGAGVDVLAVLLQQRACRRNAKNNVGKTPLDLCLEYKGPNKEAFIREVKALFRGKHYVALYRTSDNSVPPVLALSDLDLLQTRRFAESEFKALLKVSPRSGKHKHPSPTVRRLIQEKEQRSAATEILSDITNGTAAKAAPSTPKRDLYEYVLCAYAGPFDDAEQAEEFYQNWLNTYRKQPKTDLQKGHEAVGREQAWRLGFGFVESWSFLDSLGLLDLNSAEGLRAVNDHLHRVHMEVQLEAEVERLGESVAQRLVFDDSLPLEDGDGGMDEEEDLFEDAVDHFESRRSTSEEDDENYAAFSTAPQTPREERVSFTTPTYVLGRVPSKEDENLFAALDELPRELLQRYAYVAEYARQMRQVPRDERCTWPATDSPRFKRTAQKIFGTPQVQTTPVRPRPNNGDRSRSPLRRLGIGSASPSSDEDYY